LETSEVSSVVDVDSKDWDEQVVRSKQLVLVDFWHDSCVWCKRLEPELKAVTGEFSGKLRFARLNIFSNDSNNDIARKYGILGTPTLLLFCNGRPVDSLVGYRPRDQLRRELREKLEKAQDCFKQSTPV
jgi:thioredoxin 1